MKKIPMEERLIVALDVSNIDEAQKLVECLDGTVSFFKIGLALQLVAGLDLVKWLIDKEKKVFLDYKYFDVEETIKQAVSQVASIGVNFLTVHGNKRIIKAAVEGKGKSDLKILSVTVLTSLDAFDLQELGFTGSVEELVLHRAKSALEAGCDGVIASGREAQAIRKVCQNGFLIVTPGIRPDGTEIGDQKRHVTPAQAIKDGADYLVVGRPIRNAENPRLAAESIINEMKSAI
ncbi:orotidine-5'-phosphate decarboxylase [bacterium]|nr:orotidine-5'-phosphate decarboxylase [bacterium]